MVPFVGVHGYDRDLHDCDRDLHDHDRYLLRGYVRDHLKHKC